MSNPGAYSARIFKQSMGARNLAGIELSYRPARAHICKRFRSLGIDSARLEGSLAGRYDK